MKAQESVRGHTVMEPRPSMIDELTKWADAIRACRDLDEKAEPFFELMSGGVMWRDESPRRVPAIVALRPLWNHRTALVLGERGLYQEYWDHGQKLVPEWVGFHPSRCRPDAALVERIRELRRKGNREIEKCERLMRMQDRRKQRGEKP